MRNKRDPQGSRDGRSRTAGAVSIAELAPAAVASATSVARRRETSGRNDAAGAGAKPRSAPARRRIAITEAEPEPPAPPELQDEDFGLAVRLAQLIRTKKSRSPED
jgi:hypothetical protein